MISVFEINDIDQLEDFRLAWRATLNATKGASFFQSLDWLQAYWRHYGAGQKLRVLAIFGNNRPIAFLPLVVRKEATLVGTLRYLTYPLHDWGSFYGPIGPHPAAALAVGLKHVLRQPRDWDVVELRAVDDQGIDAGRTATAMRAVGMAPSRKAWMPTSLVDLSNGWDAYWATRKTHFRTNVRSCEKKLRAKYAVEYIRYRPAGAACDDADPRWDLYEACEDVARRSWQHMSPSGTTLSHDAIRPFLHDCHLAAVHAGAVDLNLLMLDGRPAAFAYNYHFRGHVSGVRMGFDAELARDGVGTLLQHQMLADSCRRGDDQFDLGAGSLECKRHWRTRPATSYALSYFSPESARAQLLRCKRTVDGWLGRTAVAVDLDARKPAKQSR